MATGRARTVLSALGLLSMCALAQPLSATDEGLSSTALRGLDAVTVEIEGVTRDYRRYGVERTQLRQRVVERLRQADLRVLERTGTQPSPSTALLSIRIHSVPIYYGAYYSYSVSVQVRQLVPLPQGRGAAAPLTTWSTGTSGRLRTYHFSRINNDVLGMVDAFVQSYKKQNRDL